MLTLIPAGLGCVNRVCARMSQIANVLRPVLANPCPNHRADNHRELIVALLLKKLLFNSLHSRVHFCTIYFYMFGRKKKKEAGWNGLGRLEPREGRKRWWELQNGDSIVIRVATWVLCYITQFTFWDLEHILWRPNPGLKCMPALFALLVNCAVVPTSPCVVVVCSGLRPVIWVF